MLDYLNARWKERSTRSSVLVLIGSVLTIVYPRYSQLIQAFVGLLSTWVMATPG